MPSKAEPAPMTDPRWERLNEVFHAAVELAPEQRVGFLDYVCSQDADLRAEVERLIAAHERAGRFIEDPAIAQAAPWLSGASQALPAGHRFGPYRVIRELGRGGMGAVYLAERADGQFEQQVALKLIKRGMDTDLVLQRFRAERQILASLDHPNIARLLDGGTTDDGRPYFVMEYIDGQPIDEYADARSLSVDDRLRLFLQVAGAVTYAHQHLIVHRDIKPVNILVTPDGLPKLLDFGIAKVLHADPDEATSTLTGLRLLTPEYASPEQVEGRPVTTASDVYSLGVVLYELLTGRSPYRPKSRDPLDVAEAVRTTDPERPSTAVTHPAAAQGHRRAGLASDRAGATGGGSTEKLRRRLRGDLDVIVLAALRKEPERRYASVEQFARDITRHLEGLPVQARADTFRYRAGKFVRRNRIAVVGAALLGMALIGGTVATAWQAHEARVQAQLARAAQARAERRFNDLRKLAHAVLFDYHDAIKDLRGSTPVRERLVRDGLGYLDGLAREAQGDPSLQRELASAYRRMGDVQGGDPRGLGDTEGAVGSYAKAMRILEALLRTNPADARIRRDFADVALALGGLIWERGDLSGGLAHARRAQAILDSLVASAPGDTQLRLQLSAAYDLLGQISLEAGEIADALEFHRADLQQLQRAPESERRHPQLRRAISVAYGHLADAQVESGDLPGALSSHRRSLALRRALAAEFPDNADFERLVGSARYYEATVLGRMDRWAEALERFRLFLAEDSTSGLNHFRVGEALAHLRRREEALGHFREALRIHAKELRADSANLFKRLAFAQAQSEVCQMLAGLARSNAGATCAGTASFITATPVEPTHAFPRAFFAALWSDLGEAYDTLAVRRMTPAADSRNYRMAARDMYRRSAEIWSDLKARGLVSPTDTGRLGAAERAVARSEAALRGSLSPKDQAQTVRRE
jgi:eukaryotic-like serine/threonine-protein kinase